MVKISLFFVAATLTSFVLSTDRIDASNVPDTFKPITMPALVEKALENTKKISNLFNDFSSLSTVNFAISRDLLASIVPYEPEFSVFLLPDTPTPALLSKLIYALTVNIKRLGSMSTVVSQYTHYDRVSRVIFQNVR